MSFRLDHLVISSDELTRGRSWVEQVLDIHMGPRGVHEAMGTHNHLVALDRGAYLEVIATDPEAPRPDRPRWFDLDRFNGGPRLTNWVVACDDLDAALAQAPDGVGRIMSFTRGPYAWRMAVPDNGVLPFDGGFPALMEWQSDHPAPALVQAGLKLRRLRITHPHATALQQALAPFAAALDNVAIVQGERPGMTAELTTPSGEIWIT